VILIPHDLRCPAIRVRELCALSSVLCVSGLVCVLAGALLSGRGARNERQAPLTKLTSAPRLRFARSPAELLLLHVMACCASSLAAQCRCARAVIAIRVDDPLAARMDNVDDVEREMPGELERIMCWFRDYKVPWPLPRPGCCQSTKAGPSSTLLRSSVDTTVRQLPWHSTVLRTVEANKLAGILTCNITMRLMHRCGCRSRMGSLPTGMPTIPRHCARSMRRRWLPRHTSSICASRLARSQLRTAANFQLSSRWRHDSSSCSKHRGTVAWHLRLAKTYASFGDTDALSYRMCIPPIA